MTQKKKQEIISQIKSLIPAAIIIKASKEFFKMRDEKVVAETQKAINSFVSQRRMTPLALQEFNEVFYDEILEITNTRVLVY